MIKKKSLGQHFLKSQKIIDDIVSASKTKKGDVVIEVGPGEGILTLALLETGAKVYSIEKDDRLIPILSEKFFKEISNKKLSLIHTDILEFDATNILPMDNKYKVVANIPYYITGQIIRKLMESKNQPESITMLVQKEVAERIVAKSRKESLLSLSVKAYGKPKYVRTVGRGAFTPQPNVDSAILDISEISRKNFKEVDENKFFKVIHAGFAHKRKQLFSNLQTIFDKKTLSSAFEKLNLDPRCRAEDLSIEKWFDCVKEL